MCGQEVLSSFFVVVYLFLAMLGLHCCAQAFSACGEPVHRLSLLVVSRGYSLVAMLRLLIVVASCVVEHGLQVLQLSSCGAQA